MYRGNRPPVFEFVELDTDTLGYDLFVKTGKLLEILGWEKQESTSTNYPIDHAWAKFLYDPERENYELTMKILDVIYDST